jgi:hypothetical protein
MAWREDQELTKLTIHVLLASGKRILLPVNTRGFDVFRLTYGRSIQDVLLEKFKEIGPEDGTDEDMVPDTQPTAGCLGSTDG